MTYNLNKMKYSFHIITFDIYKGFANHMEVADVFNFKPISPDVIQSKIK